ncbi:MAG: hypothetical protein ACLP59_05030 [Bryobacteraceae bacterium]
MISFLADENLKRPIVNGMLRRNPSVDVIRVQDAGLTELKIGLARVGGRA